MKPFVVYLAHPVNAPTLEGVEANLESALEWLQHLVDNSDWVISMPWYPYVKKLSKAGQYGAYRERGLRDDCVHVSRSDAILCVGGAQVPGRHLTPGMHQETDTALQHGVVVGNLMHLDRPQDATAFASILTEARGPGETASVNFRLQLCQFEGYAQQLRSAWFKNGGPHLYRPTHCGSCGNIFALCSCR